MKDHQIQAKEHNEAQAQRQHNASQSRTDSQPLQSDKGRHQQCPPVAVKIHEGVYDCGDGMLFIGDRA